jgi:hypothetical protein
MATMKNQPEILFRWLRSTNSILGNQSATCQEKIQSMSHPAKIRRKEIKTSDAPAERNQIDGGIVPGEEAAYATQQRGG